jgi:hypothetical protein
MDEEMLEAHVAFEVAAWTDSLTETLGTGVVAVFEWLDTVSMGSVFSESDLDALIYDLPVPDLTTSILAAHATALQDGTTLGELVRREDYDRIASTLATMTDLQEAVVEQITTSEVYADLISHVLFHGIRNYVMTESPIARVPGASSLMRIGQNAFDTAAPRLSKGIEKQLTAFVSANLQETLRESKQFLTSVVDEQTMDEVSEDVFTRNENSTVADLAALVPEETIAELLAVAQEMWAHLITTPTFRELLQAALDANAARPVGELLAEAGVTAETVTSMARPWILRAADDGMLEELIRERLTAFYATYE